MNDDASAAAAMPRATHVKISDGIVLSVVLAAEGASRIAATLADKGILTKPEARELMYEIADALRQAAPDQDVSGEAATEALARYLESLGDEREAV